MAPRKACTECGEPTSSANALTCSDSCRQKRSRRLRRRSGEAKDVVEQHLREGLTDISRDVIREELKPRVREAMTEDVLKGIDRMIGLTPRVIEQIEKDLDSDDPNVRQRAYTLVVKYTMGNPSVAPAAADAAPGGVSIHFALPRPGTDGTGGGGEAPDEPVDAEVVEPEATRVCVVCDQDKPESEFVGASDRCVTCHSEVHKLADKFLTKPEDE